MVEAARRLSGIEALRGIAATIVVLYHAARHVDKAHGAPWLMWTFLGGHAGVDLFFVISGFIIFYVHEKDVGRPKRLTYYVVRRFVRIMPLYWIALAITAVMAVLGHGAPSASTLAWSASLLPTVEEPFLGIAWTLQFEMVFYAAFALFVLNRSAGVVVFTVWGAVMVAGAAGLRLPGAAWVLSSGYGAEFFAGMAAAVLVRRSLVRAPLVVATVGAGLFVAAMVAESLGILDGRGGTARIVFGCPAGLIVAGLAAADQVGHGIMLGGFWGRLLRKLGVATYSIYLFQFVFIGVVWQVWLRAGLAERISDVLLFVCLSAAALVGGVVVSRTIEHPLRRRMQERHQPGVVQAG